MQCGNCGEIFVDPTLKKCGHCGKPFSNDDSLMEKVPIIETNSNPSSYSQKALGETSFSQKIWIIFKQILAYILDAYIIVFLMNVWDPQIWLSEWMWVANYIWALPYFVIFSLVWNGKTLGKALLNIHSIDAKTCNPVRSVGRNLLDNLTKPNPFLLILDILLGLFFTKKGTIPRRLTQTMSHLTVTTKKNTIKTQYKPILLVMIIGPTISELLSGSTPLVYFFVPLNFFLFSILYGCGALIMREIYIRANKGWLSLILLGIAYAIIEEGIMFKSFFEENYFNIPEFFRGYGYVDGVNWLYVFLMILNESTFSICVVNFLAHLIFPEKRKQPWLSDRVLGFFIILFVLVVYIGFYYYNPYPAPVIPTIICYVLVGLLMIVSVKIPSKIMIKSNSNIPRLRYLCLLGFGWTLGTALIFYFPWLNIPYQIGIIYMCILWVGEFIGVAWLYGKGKQFTDLHKYTLVLGAFAFFFLHSPIMEFQGHVGQILAHIIAMTIFIRYWKKLRNATRKNNEIVLT